MTSDYKVYVYQSYLIRMSYVVSTEKQMTNYDEFNISPTHTTIIKKKKTFKKMNYQMTLCIYLFPNT